MRVFDTYPTLHKSAAVGAQLFDYAQTRATFSWARAAKSLSGLPQGGGLNIAHEAVDRHANTARGDKVALRCLRGDGSREDITFRQLMHQSNRFAHALQHLGIVSGDTVCTVLGRVPELFLAALGTWKHRAVFCPLFSAFGPAPLAARINLGNVRLLVTSPGLYERKIKPMRERLPSLRWIVLTGHPSSALQADNVLWLEPLLARESDAYRIHPTSPEAPAVLHFTSGTTGTPKGAVHVHQAVLSHHVTAKYALDLRSEDLFWCTADPGWVTGTSYGVIAPLTHGVTTLVDEGEFDASRWYQTLAQEKVSVWYTSPTAIRMLMKAGSEVSSGCDLRALRFVASVGEPLNPEAVLFGQKAFGQPVHDNYWQTETGGIMISNFAAMDVKPGSMGRPLPGIDAAIVRRLSNEKLEFLPPRAEGELAFKVGWPSMFREYLHEEARYKKCFVEGHYLTGDLACVDEDGYFWFLGRADDVIKSAGHLIGPFEVESALMAHPAVAEAAVIGLPHPLLGEVIKAFVSLRRDFEPSSALREELLGFSRSRLGPVLSPKEIVLTSGLPKTRSGKLMRRLLRARELGLPEGDLSTLEQAE